MCPLNSLSATFTAVFSLWNGELGPTLITVLGHGHPVYVEGYSPVASKTRATGHSLSRGALAKWNIIMREGTMTKNLGIIQLMLPAGDTGM